MKVVLRFVASSGEVTVGEGPSDEINKYIHDNPSDITYVQVCYQGLVFTWRQPFKRFENSHARLGEVQIIASDISTELIKDAVRRIGTPAIAHRSDELLRSVGVVAN